MADTTVTHASDHHSPEDLHHASLDNLWDGAKSPFKASYGKLMMWYFLLSDAFTFAGFLIAYGALRFSMPTWPEPDFVFASFPFVDTVKTPWPLIFVTVMTFVLIGSSVTMVRAVQEGHRENPRGVVFWMFLTILGGASFLGCQAYEWTTLIAKENMSLSVNPFGRHTADGVYLNPDGSVGEEFEAGESYLLHKASHGEGHEEGHHGPTHLVKENEAGFLIPQVRYKDEKGELLSEVKGLNFGPKAFGALFFFITGFHGFHVFSGVLFLSIIAINSGGGVYAARRNGYEMVEKIGLYWHFVDLVWVFVFLVFYLL